MLRPAQLANLALTLTHHGYAVSTHQILAAAKLLAQVAEPVAVVDLAVWLAPVFCSSAQQQRDFCGIYQQWARTGLDLDSATQAGSQAQETPIGTAKIALCQWWRERALEFSRQRGAQILAIATLATLALALFIHNNVVLKAGAAASETSLASSARQQMGGKTTADKISSPNRDLQKHVPLRVPMTINHAVAIVAVSAVIPLLIWLIVALRRRGFLERHPSKKEYAAIHLRTSKISALASWKMEMAALGRTLRRRVSRISPDLDVSATVANYYRNGIMSKLFFGGRHEPEYLVLIDRASKYDHFAKIADELVCALRDDSGVNTHVYVFKSDPRKLRHQHQQGKPTTKSSAVSLNGIVGNHPQARVMIFSDGHELISPLTGQPVIWLPTLLQWPQTVLITPKAQAYWSGRERMLRRAGLQVVPLNNLELEILGTILTTQRGTPQTALGDFQHATPSYLRDVAGLLDTSPPPQVEEIFMELSRDLGPCGYMWLCACAIYPEIHWGITLTMGRTFLAEEEPEKHLFARLLVSLSALPWLRYGYMPDWLRERLLDSLDPSSAALARKVLAVYLMTVTKSVQPEVDTDNLRIGELPKQAFWKDFLNGCTALLRSPSIPVIREDRIYLRFMSGKSSHLAVPLSEKIEELFYHYGSSLGKPKKFPYIIFFIIIGSVTSFILKLDFGVEVTPTKDPVVIPKHIDLANDGLLPDVVVAPNTLTTDPVPLIKDGDPVPNKLLPDAVVMPKANAPPQNNMDEATVYSVGVTLEATGHETRHGPEKIYRFWLTGPSERFPKIRNVVYFMDNPTFKKKRYISSDSTSGFAQYYKGWGCLSDVAVTINYKDNQGATQFNVNMCEALYKIPASAAQQTLEAPNAAAYAPIPVP